MPFFWRCVNAIINNYEERADNVSVYDNVTRIPRIYFIYEMPPNLSISIFYFILHKLNSIIFIVQTIRFQYLVQFMSLNKSPWIC